MQRGGGILQGIEVQGMLVKFQWLVYNSLMFSPFDDLPCSFIRYSLFVSSSMQDK